MSLIDPRGLNGDVTIDKKEKKMTVRGKYYYNKSDENLKKYAITEDHFNRRGGDPYPSLISQINLEDQSFVDDNGEEWTVSFEIQFIAKDSKEEVDEALKLDPTANQILYKTSEDYRQAASWDTSERSINIFGITAPSSFVHEMFHGFGLPHAVFIPGSPEGIFGTMEDYGLEDVNGLGKTFGPLMSYASEHSLQGYELHYMLQNAINLSKKVENNQVNVHISGFPYKNVTKEQMEKQFPYDRKKYIEGYMKLKETYKDEIIKN